MQYTIQCHLVGFSSLRMCNDARTNTNHVSRTNCIWSTELSFVFILFRANLENVSEEF